MRNNLFYRNISTSSQDSPDFTIMSFGSEQISSRWRADSSNYVRRRKQRLRQETSGRQEGQLKNK